MKNRILIIGNNDFSREYYEDGVFKINNKKYISSLYAKYDVFNFSKDNLNCVSAKCMTKLFCDLYDFKACVISLGLAEIKNNDINDFENHLRDLVELLISKNVEPILLEVDSDNYNVVEVNSIIKRVRSEYNLKNDLFNDLIICNPKLQLCH